MRSRRQWGDDLRMIWRKEERGGEKATAATVRPLLRWWKGVAGGPGRRRHASQMEGGLALLAVGSDAAATGERRRAARAWFGQGGQAGADRWAMLQ
jgi:hypothetical protein